MDDPSDPSDDFESFLENLAPLTDAEQAELLLTYFNEVLKGLSTDALRMLRWRVSEMHPGTPEETMVLEVIDGLIALRDLAAEDGDPGPSD
jgi:hypothetical protein